ncbi:hypothetical protein [Streptomyces mirabilis]
MRNGKRALAGIASMIAGGFILVGGMAISPGSAQATNNVDLSDIAMIDTCPQMNKDVRYKADDCNFVPDGAETYQSEYYIPEGDYYAWNCTDAIQDHQWQITDVSHSANSLGVGVDVGGKLFDVVELAMHADYGHQWLHGKFVWTGNTIHVSPGRVGWLELSTELAKVHGKWEMNYGDPVAFDPGGAPGGYHYSWTLFNYWQVDAKQDGNRRVIFKDRDMTPEERDRICGDHGNDPGGQPQVLDNGLRITPLPATRPDPLKPLEGG